ncbi:MAG TPA: FprA family A-type flavoprotein [Spirochaetia bacterium]|nr:FprA family A-type flavoprotein [Spirochaetia bacterium]
MPSVEIRPGIFWIGLNDRTTDLFEGIWPVSDAGVTYNSYVIRGEKNVIVDLAKGFKTDEYFDLLDSIVPLDKIDYIVVNHMEPDHTGAIRALTRIPRKCTLLATEKAREMLAAYYGLTENIQIVADGEELSIGGKTLRFVHTPFVHWPETMVTYDSTDRILFSCDAFGGYGTLPGTSFDDQVADLLFYEREALRYYVNIVAKFSTPTLKAIEKLSGVPVEIIAPSHGLVWRRDPGRIVDLYKKWAGLAAGGGERGVTLVYGSMYGNTEKMMNAVAQGISRSGLPVEIFDAARTHTSYILPALWTWRGVMVGAPTYEGSLFPPVAQALDMAVLKRVVNKKAAIFGSYGWSKGGMAAFQKIVEPLKWDVTDILEFRGGPTAELLKKGEEFGERFAAAVKTP